VTTDGSPNAYVSSCQAASFRLSDPGQADNNGLVAVAGGTSFASPEFAGLLAIIEQKLASAGGLGNINPSLYKLASNATTYASAFHDITVGNNQVPCTPGSSDCPTGSDPVIGYVAGTGYDQATGLGSVDAGNLATAFAALVAATATKTAVNVTPGVPVKVATSGKKATTTSVTASPSSFELWGSITLTATVSGATAGTLTGNMTFTTAGVTIGAVQQVTLGSGNTANATLTVTATAPLGFVVGTDTITATYGGDAYNASSSGTTSVTASNPGITLSAMDMTIAAPSPGHSGTSTITLTSTGGYAGTAVVS
jgi:hypothetical protein